MHDPMPSGWFPDPLGRYEHRYFNGQAWTSDVSTGGRRSVDPLGTAPGGSGTGRATNGAATAAVVMGSVGVAIAWIPFVVVIGLVLSILAVVFGVRGLRQARTSGVGRGAAVAGTTMGALGLAAAVIGTVLSVMVWREIVAFVDPGDHTVGAVECRIDDRRTDVDGTITNDDDDRRSYVVFVELDGETRAIEVPDVGAGETVAWQVTIITFAPPIRCDPEVVVQGPFPYGLEVDPVNRPISP